MTLKAFSFGSYVHKVQSDYLLVEGCGQSEIEKQDCHFSQKVSFLSQKVDSLLLRCLLIVASVTV
jgi:hypothetical protein